MSEVAQAIAEWAARLIGAQTPVEPEFAAILYRNRSEMYLRERSEPPPQTREDPRP